MSEKTEWMSIRNEWPTKSGIYYVKDCQNCFYGTAMYDGYDWQNIEHKRGSLILADFKITHWKEQENQNVPEN